MQSVPVLIIAHGQPSDPERAEAELAILGQAVAALRPEGAVGTATLAAPGRLEVELARLGPSGRIYPLFMAGGWFTRVHLPKRVQAAGGQDWRVLEPMGCDPAVQDLAVLIAAEAGDCDGVILAAHGSGQSRVPSDIADHVAEMISARLGVPARAAFIDQSPRITDLTDLGPRTICLPFFAAAGGHVTMDIPQALSEAGFSGRLLPALGLDARVAGLITAALRADLPVCSAQCRWARA